MSCYYIKVEKGRKVARPITSEQEYRELRNSSQQMANLRLARNGNDAAKRRLVQMNYSGHYIGTHAAGRDGGGADAHAARHKRAALLAGDGVLVRGDVHLVQIVLQLLAGAVLVGQVFGTRRYHRS